MAENRRTFVIAYAGLSSSVAFTVIVCLVAFCGSNACAQQSTATLSGAVTDGTGALVPDSEVYITDAQTGIQRKTGTDERGRFSASNLAAGQYTVEVHKQGYQATIEKNITLTVGLEATVDLSLRVGEVSQTVVVQAGTNQVETNTVEVSSLVDSREIRNLPLNGRNFEQLILLAPGAQPVGSVNATANYGRNISFSVSGSRPSDQYLLLDGQDIQTFWGHGAGNTMTGNSLGVDAIAEYQTITNTYGANYGGSGSVINAGTRAGTNRIHGSVYEYIRNSRFDAHNYFDKPATPPSFRRNQFGATIGGPIQKNKTFYFGNYEGFRQALGTTLTALVPDVNAHAGLINGKQYVISPTIAPYLALYPACSTAGADSVATGLCQLFAVNSTSTNEDYVNVRIDRSISTSDSVFGRYVFDNGTVTIPLSSSLIAGWPEFDFSKNQFFTLSETHIVSSKLIVQSHFDFGRTNTHSASGGSNPLLQFFPARQNGTINVTGLTGLGTTRGTPILYVQNKFNLGVNATLSKGGHEVRFGLDVKRQQSNFSFGNNGAGYFVFSGLVSFLQNQASSFAGIPAGGYLPERGARETQIFPYIQDNWKMSRNIAIIAGLRYEFVTNPTESQAQFHALINYATDPVYSSVKNAFITNPSYKNIDPRVGVVWDPQGTGKTSVRAGFGVYHIIAEPREYSNSFSNTLPLISATQTNPTFPNAFVGAFKAVPSLIFGNDWHTHQTPYMMQYNLNIQRQLVADTTLTVGYVGSRGVHQLIVQNLNPPVTTVNNGVYTIANPTANVNPAFGSLALSRPIGSSNYNSLQVNAKKSFSHGLDAQVAYTYSKYLDQGSASGAGQESQLSNSSEPSNPYTLTGEYGRSSYDVRHTFVANAVYALPFHGNVLFEGYQFTTIASLHTGFPFTVQIGTPEADQTYSFGDERPNVVPGYSSNPLLRKVTQWYDPAAFSEPAPGTFGNLGRNTLTGPGTVDFDAGLQKDTSIRKVSESFIVQLRAEMFNVANHPNFGLPLGSAFSGKSSIVNGVVTNGAANPLGPVITSTNTTARQMQFSLKFIY